MQSGISGLSREPVLPSKNMNLFRTTKVLLSLGAGLTTSTVLIALSTPLPMAITIPVLITTIIQFVVLTTLYMYSLDEQED